MNTKNDKDLLNMDDLDKQIEAIHTRPHLIDNIQKAKAETEKKNEDAFSLGTEIKKYWFLYLFLVISALFTGTLGVYMGLAPTVSGNEITFHDDLAHVVLAVVYCVAFIGVTEAAFAIGKHLYYTHEDGNKTQTGTTIVMMIVSGVAVLLTGVSGGSVIASFVSFMSAFAEVPLLAQKWIVTAIPLLIVIYSFLITGYVLSSEYVRSKRVLREQERKSEIDHELRTKTMEHYGEELLQKAELTSYIRMVEAGKISAADAKAAISAGRTLGQEERRRGEDIDGNGIVGTTHPIPEVVERSNGNGPHPSKR